MAQRRVGVLGAGLLLALLALTQGCLRALTGASASRRPNVVLITLDTTRADHLGCYGYPKATSPHLDRLAAQGVLFTHAIAQASVTPVSHASILTGRDPYHHGLRVMHGMSSHRLADSQVTLAEVLKAAGYRTGAFVSAFPVSERFGLHQGFDVFDADFLEEPAEELVTKEGIVNTGTNQRRADETTRRALAWLDEAEAPTFLWIHYFDPHDPLLLPPGVAAPADPTRVRKQLRELYDVEIRYMDEQIGRVLARLDEDGRAGETVVAVVADHGEGLGDHGWWSHGILYQEQIRVPLILRAAAAEAGRRVERLVRTTDLAPTLLDLAGVPSEDHPPMDGRSLVPLLRGESPDPGQTAYADSVNTLTYHIAHGVTDRKDEMLFAIVDGPWKYIHHAIRPDRSELYNLADDPGEKHNRIGADAAVAGRLRAELESRSYRPPDPSKTPDEMSPEDLERLKSLGYVVE